MNNIWLVVEISQGGLSSVSQVSSREKAVELGMKKMLERHKNVSSLSTNYLDLNIPEHIAKVREMFDKQGYKTFGGSCMDWNYEIAIIQPEIVAD